METSSASWTQPSGNVEHTSSVQSFEINEEQVLHKYPFYSRSRNAFARKFPRLNRAAVYLRGPRPKKDLEDPAPLLAFTIDTGHGRVRRAATVPLEPTWIRLTHYFNSPSLFILLAALYIIGLAFFSREQSFLIPASSFADCTSTYWLANDRCGLDGINCLPTTYSTFDFRCPAQCTTTILQNPRTVGDEQVVYEPLIVGGGDSNKTYRGDSFLCSAAVHAGVMSDSKGGCASLQLVANYTNFLPKTANGLSSIGFPTIFPIGYQMLETTSLHHCTDYRTPALAANAVITASLFLLFRPKPIVLYWSLVCIGYWHISLFSQPRASPPSISDVFATFLPTLFIAYAFWRLAFRFVLPAFMKMPIEATVLYLLPFWVGVLNNLTFDRLPISRLLASDLTKRPGAITSFIVIVIVILVLVFNQMRIIRKTGWLGYYLFWYITGGLIALVLSQLPGLTLRVHHYVLAMAFIPMTAWPTRLSAIYQGLLLGLFLNGAAAFGFDSILQTAAQLQQDGPSGSLLPTFITNSTNYNASIPLENLTISWGGLRDGWDGFALLIDDVERYAGPALNYSLLWLEEGLPHFIRLAFTYEGTAGDFTMPATIYPNGTWVDPRPGPS